LKGCPVSLATNHLITVPIYIKIQIHNCSLLPTGERILWFQPRWPRFVVGK